MRKMTLVVAGLAVVALAGCDRTGTNSTKETGTTTQTGTNTGTTGTNTGTTGTNTGTTGTNTGTNTGTGTGFSCSDGPSDPDQLFADQFASLYGSITDTPYAVTGGVQAVVDAANALGSGETAAVDLVVSGAVVTNIDYLPESASYINFWFGDSEANMRTFGTDLGGVDMQSLRRGQTVSFRVTELKNYAGEFEVTALTDFEVIDDSTQAIHVVDANTKTLDYAIHGRANVSLYGEITELQGECGSSNCWTFETGGGQALTLRVSNIVELYEGDCIWWMGPIASYNGLQLSATNFDWFSYF